MISLFEGQAKHILLKPRKPEACNEPKKRDSNKVARSKKKTNSAYHNGQK